jgi:hypothetical protein
MSTAEDTPRQEAANNVCENNVNPINHWAQEGSWPKEYFEQDSQTKKGLEQYICLEDYLIKQEMAHILPLCSRWCISTSSLGHPLEHEA